MRINLKDTIACFTLFSLCSALCISAEKQGIRSFDFNEYFNEKFKECLAITGEKNAVRDVIVRFHDFNSDGSDEAVVVGSSCYTGSAGPDIHSVYRMNGRRKIEEIEIVSPKIFRGKPVFDHLVGNRNYDLQARHHSLCEVYHDSSGHKNPLTICYRLRHGKFMANEIKIR